MALSLEFLIPGISVDLLSRVGGRFFEHGALSATPTLLVLDPGKE